MLLITYYKRNSFYALTAERLLKKSLVHCHYFLSVPNIFINFLPLSSRWQTKDTIGRFYRSSVIGFTNSRTFLICMPTSEISVNCSRLLCYLLPGCSSFTFTIHSVHFSRSVCRLLVNIINRLDMWICSGETLGVILAVPPHFSGGPLLYVLWYCMDLSGCLRLAKNVLKCAQNSMLNFEKNFWWQRPQLPILGMGYSDMTRSHFTRAPSLKTPASPPWVAAQ